MHKYSPDHVHLVYYTHDGEELDQPASDIVTVGTLIDPDSGDDLEVDHVVISQNNTPGGTTVSFEQEDIDAVINHLRGERDHWQKLYDISQGTPGVPPESINEISKRLSAFETMLFTLENPI